MNEKSPSDKIDDLIGHLGWYIAYLVIVACYQEIPAGINSVVSVFISAQTDYRCKTCFDDVLMSKFNDTSINNPEIERYNSLISDNFFEQLDGRCGLEANSCQVSSLVLTENQNSTEITSDIAECCYAESMDQAYCQNPNLIHYNYNQTYTSCSEYIYDTSVYKSTTIQEFDLVCQNAWIADLTTSLYYAGFGIGGIVSGILSDIYGRKPVLIAFGACLMVSDVVTGFMPSILTFTIFRVLNGFFVNAIIVPGYILASEFIGSKYRPFMTMFHTAIFAFGIMLLSYPFAAIFNEWRDLQKWISITCVPVILWTLVIPESYKFIISKGDADRAYDMAKQILIKNKSKVGKSDYQPSDYELEQLRENIDIQVDEIKKSSDKVESKPTLIDLFKNKNMRKITLNLMFNWFVNSMVYYGLSLNAGSLPGTDIFNNFINGMIEIPAYIVFPFLLQWPKLGRKGTSGVFLILGGICCLASTMCLQFRPCPDPEFPEEEQTQDILELLGQILAFMGKFCIAGTFAICYNYTAEIYPAEVRSTGLAICSFGARLAGIVSPFVLSLQNLQEWLPGVIFAVLAFLSGSLAFLLPETLGMPFLSTLEETERIYFGKQPEGKVAQGVENQAATDEAE